MPASPNPGGELDTLCSSSSPREAFLSPELTHLVPDRHFLAPAAPRLGGKLPHSLLETLLVCPGREGKCCGGVGAAFPSITATCWAGPWACVGSMQPFPHTRCHSPVPQARMFLSTSQIKETKAGRG